MNKDGGFLKVYRSMLTWEWHDDPLTMATWIYCLMRANYETVKWHGEIIKAGQFITSLGHMAKDIGITVSQLRTCIKRLKSTSNIASQSTSRGTLITVANYGLYQSAGEKVTSHLTSTLASESQADDKPLTTDKEREERKERKEEREYREKAPVIPEEAHISVDGEDYHYRNGVLQYSPDETRELLRTAHEGWLETKRRLGML